MSQGGGRVDWYGKDVLLVIENASDEILTQAAFQAEALAKTGDVPVDTGFMRNAIYGIGPGGSHRSQSAAQALSSADRDLAPEVALKEHEAGLHGAAGYTLYQETKHGFMYSAVERLAAQMGGIIQQVSARFK